MPHILRGNNETPCIAIEEGNDGGENLTITKLTMLNKTPKKHTCRPCCGCSASSFVGVDLVPEIIIGIMAYFLINCCFVNDVAIKDRNDNFQDQL